MSTLNSKSFVASGSILNLGLHIFRSIVNFVIIFLATRWLGSEGYGEFSLILSYTVYLSYLLTLGLDQSLPFFISKVLVKERVSTYDLFFSSLKLLSFCAFFFIPIGTILIFLFFPHSQRHLMASMFLLTFQHFIFAIIHMAAGYLRGHKIFYPWMIKEHLFFPIMQLLLLVLFVKIFQMDVLGYALGYSLAVVLTVIPVLIYLIPFLKKEIKEKKPPKKISRRELLVFSFPLALMGALDLLTGSISVTLSGLLLGSKESGLISVFLRFGMLVQFLFLALRPIFSPYIARLLRGDGQEKELKDLYQSANFWSAKWSLCIIFQIALNASWILSFLGPDFESEVGGLLLILPGFFFMAVCGLAHQGVMMAGEKWHGAVSYFISIILNLVLSFLLFRSYGLNGVAIALSASFFILSFLGSLKFTLLCGVFPLHLKQTFFLALMSVLLFSLGYFIHMAVDPSGERFVLSTLVTILIFLIAFYQDRNFF